MQDDAKKKMNVQKVLNVEKDDNDQTKDTDNDHTKDTDSKERTKRKHFRNVS